MMMGLNFTFQQGPFGENKEVKASVVLREFT